MATEATPAVKVTALTGLSLLDSRLLEGQVHGEASSRVSEPNCLCQGMTVGDNTDTAYSSIKIWGKHGGILDVDKYHLWCLVLVLYEDASGASKSNELSQSAAAAYALSRLTPDGRSKFRGSDRRLTNIVWQDNI